MWPSKPCRGERNFWMQRPEAEIGLRDRKCHRRPKERKRYRGKSPQKRPALSRPGNPQFGRTGWWCGQSDTNRSPCYSANIRVIFEKNRERNAKNPRKRRQPANFSHFEEFHNREKQGGCTLGDQGSCSSNLPCLQRKLVRHCDLAVQGTPIAESCREPPTRSDAAQNANKLASCQG
jgi:hypothetical protein